jgi:hypothetical protein
VIRESQTVFVVSQRSVFRRVTGIREIFVGRGFSRDM